MRDATPRRRGIKRNAPGNVPVFSLLLDHLGRALDGGLGPCERGASRAAYRALVVHLSCCVSGIEAAGLARASERMISQCETAADLALVKRLCRRIDACIAYGVAKSAMEDFL